MRALITGGGGFVGQHLCDHLLRCGDEVVSLGLGSQNERPGVTTVAVDIQDFDAVERAVRETEPHCIYHLAAISFVPSCEKNFLQALQVNVGGTFHLVKAATSLTDMPKFVMISSGEVHAGTTAAELPLTEHTPPAPTNAYSTTKVMAETVVLTAARTAGLPYVIMRPFNHLGPGQDDRFMASSFAAQLIQIKHHKKPPVLEVGDLTAERNFTDVRDIVRAYRRAAEQGSGTYLVGSETTKMVSEVLDELIRLNGVLVEKKTDSARLRGHERSRVALKPQFTRVKELGWLPEIQLSTTLADMLAWWDARI